MKDNKKKNLMKKLLHTHISFVKVAYGELKRHFFRFTEFSTLHFLPFHNDICEYFLSFETSSSLCSFDLITLTAL